MPCAQVAMPNPKSESVGHLGVLQLREKCRENGVAVRGARKELLKRLKTLGFEAQDERIRKEHDHPAQSQSHRRCPTCHQIVRMNHQPTGKHATGLKRSELQQSVIKDQKKRPRIQTARFEPGVERSEIEDDKSSDWDNISVDSEVVPESCESPVEWQELNVVILDDDDDDEDSGGMHDDDN